MKIGLTTIYTVPNFGSVLQAFATQVVLERAGAECKVINYLYPNSWNRKQTGARISLKSKLAYLLQANPSHRMHRKLKGFIASHFHLTRLYHSLEELQQEDWSSYDAFCAGSDQIWNAKFLKGESVFMLSFAPENAYKFSLASSFAMKTIPDEYVPKYQKYLSRFDRFSVRECQGVHILKEQLGFEQDAQVMPDPTLMLSGEEWVKAVGASTKKPKRPYILLYGLYYAFEPCPYIFKVLKHFHEKLGCDILALEGYKSAEQAEGVKMKDVKNSTITEFIQYFANAEMVVTSSFHGTAFALNFSKPLVSVVPGNKADDRQSNLLRMVGAEQCIASTESAIADLNPFYNSNQVESALQNLRTESAQWISDTLLAIKR